MTGKWIAVVGLVALGCGADVGDSSWALHDAAPLPMVERAAWESAPAGCEGQLQALGASIRFGIADGEPEFIVASEIDGSLVCMDTYAAVEAELATTGREDLGETLWLRYVARFRHLPRAERPFEEAGPEYSEQLTPLIDTSMAEGDPNPQPNRPGLEPTQIAPSEGDPNPQPNDDSVATASLNGSNMDDEGSDAVELTPTTPPAPMPTGFDGL